MLTLKAAGLVDVDAGEIVRPAIVRIDDGRIVGLGEGSQGPDDQVIDLGDAILLPGLMDMEVNLLMGGRGETPACPRCRTIRRSGCYARSATPGARYVRVHHGAQPRIVRQDRRIPA